MSRDNTKMKVYLSEHPFCESCGRIATEVHHVVPISLGGTDDEKNYVAYCRYCHMQAHKGNMSISELTRIGIDEARHSKKPYSPLISVVELLSNIDKYEPTSAIEIIDIIMETSRKQSHGYIEIKGGKF